MSINLVMGRCQAVCAVTMLFALWWRDVIAVVLTGFLVANTLHAVNHFLDRDGGNPASTGSPVPAAESAVVAFGGSFKTSGHTEWVDARVHQTGFTTVFTPNTRVPFNSGGVDYDIDFNSSREGVSATNVTYAAITARSWHLGVVNAAFLDGSVRTVTSSVTKSSLRAAGTCCGQENEPMVGD